MTGYDAWSAFSFDIVAHITRLSDQELGRQLARMTGRPKPYSRSLVASWRAGTASPPLNVYLACVELAGVDLPYAAQLAPNRPFACDRVTQLPKAVGAEHRIQLKVVPGLLALISLLAFAFVALSTHSASPQVWAKAAQQAVQQLPAQVNSDSGTSSSPTSATIQTRQVAIVDADDAPTKPSPSAVPATRPTPSPSAGPSQAQAASTSVGVSAEAQWDQRMRARVQAEIAAKAAPPPTPTPTPIPTAAAVDGLASGSVSTAPASASAASSASTP